MPEPHPHPFLSFFAELRRRRVVRTAVVYVVAAFAALQGADILVPALDLPEWTMTLLVVLVLVGFPVALGLAWAFDVVPAGTQDEKRGVREERRPRPAAPPPPQHDAAPQSAPPAWPAPPTHESAPLASQATPPHDHSPQSAPPASHHEAPPYATSADYAGRDSAPAPPAPLHASAGGPSVAVVPFLNMSSDPENEYFADGITEDIIAQLSKIRAVRVISRASVMPFKKREQTLREVGAKLGATTVLDGSVRRAGDRVRIVAELVDVGTDQHLWGETYDRQLTDVFAIQTDVALQIANALKAELTPEEQTRIGKEPTSSVQAYQLYLKGRSFYVGYTPADLRRAVEYFERAVAADPTYALAHAGIAMAYAELADSGAMPSEEALGRAAAASERALRFDPDLCEAHVAVGHLKSLGEFDWEGAEAAFRRAIELCPNSADAYDLYGRMCGALERYDEALAMQRRAQELDPLAHQTDVASTLLRAGRYAEAEAEGRRAAEFDPENERGHATLGWALFKRGKLEEGLAELRRAVELSPTTFQWQAQLGQALALAGREEEAREILRRLEARAETEFVAPNHLAFIYTGLGEYERALDLLEQAAELRIGSVYSMKGSFLLAPLRQHPRFQALLARMNVRD